MREELFRRREDPYRHSAVDRVADGAQTFGERLPRGPQLGVEHRHLERGLRHRVAFDAGEDALHRSGVDVVGGEEPRDEVCAHHVCAPSAYSDE